MARRRTRSRIVHHTMTDSEVMRIKMYLIFGGFHYRIVAARVWGNGKNYVPSAAEICRVGKIARENNMSSRDWRNGKTPESKRVLNHIGRTRATEQPRLKLAAG